MGKIADNPECQKTVEAEDTLGVTGESMRLDVCELACKMLREGNSKLQAENEKLKEENMKLRTKESKYEDQFDVVTTRLMVILNSTREGLKALE